MPEGGMEEIGVNFWGSTWELGGVRILVIVMARQYKN